ncbi:MAG TPA: heme o synthase [Patescibacteria group bacterium]|nr:heme o synthase [Patescibacteria group bacterium]
MLKAYYHLTKPGIIYGNSISAIAGFLLAAKGHPDFWLLLAVLAGTSLVIASGCVFNNYIDRGIDVKMARTKKRALVTGEISGRNALGYATLLGLAGFAVLIAWTNWLVVLIGFIALFFYVVLYGIAKRRSVHGTIVGSVSGSAPIVAGYCAVTGRFDTGAALLFLILTVWQMPHFYAIATYRSKDYAAAGLPVLPVKQGVKSAKRYMLGYIVAFIAATLALTVAGITGVVYAVIMLLAGVAWLYKSVQGFSAPDDNKWARKLFGFSLLVLLVFCFTISVDSFLP